MAQKLNVNTSIVDYLKSVGKDSSFNARKKLASEIGIVKNIEDYKGTAQQNINMLSTLKSGATTKKAETPKAPKVPEAVKPVTQPDISPIALTTAQPVTEPITQSAIQPVTPQEAKAPTPYESPYSAQIDTILNNIINRQPFNYSLSADPIYNQYKDAYTKSGNLAMRDTMGNASALTGGYGSSYGQTVGQQAYDQHMGQLNNVIPELYQAAYGRYQNEHSNQLNNLSALQGLEQQAYGQHRDTVGDYQADRAFDYGRYIDEQSQANLDRQFDYGVSQDALSQQNYLNEFAYMQAQDALSQSNWDKQFEYGVSQDDLAQQNWQTSFDYGKQMDNRTQQNYINERSYNRSQDAIDRENYLKEFAHKQAQDALSQSNWDKQFEHGKEQDTLDRQSSLNSSDQAQRDDKISRYTKEVNSMLNSTVKNGLGMESSEYTIDEVWDYLMGSDLDSDEIAYIINGNYKLRMHAESKVGKGVTDSGRTYSYGGRQLMEVH